MRYKRTQGILRLCRPLNKVTTECMLIVIRCVTLEVVHIGVCLIKNHSAACEAYVSGGRGKREAKRGESKPSSLPTPPSMPSEMSSPLYPCERPDTLGSQWGWYTVYQVNSKSRVTSQRTQQ